MAPARSNQSRYVDPIGARLDEPELDEPELDDPASMQGEGEPPEPCHAHNVPAGFSRKARPFGIRVTLPAGDPMGALLGDQWEAYHWYETERERDLALADMASEHLYSRRGDRPRIELEPVHRASSTDPSPPARTSEKRRDSAPMALAFFRARNHRSWRP